MVDQDLTATFLAMTRRGFKMPTMKTLARKTAKSNKTSAPMIKATTVSETLRGSHGDIAARSYELYLARGGEPGHAEEDWLQAERELSGR
jgi:Protein of unknown function (DUF2934)